MNFQKYLAGGMLGDFIHSLTVVKHLSYWDKHDANLFLSESGDTWKYGVQKAYYDLFTLITGQPYIHSFHKDLDDDVKIDLNKWRERVATTHAETGKYNTCWTELLADVYGYKPVFSKWLQIYEFDPVTNDRIVIHRSKHRHNQSFDWPSFMTEKCVFVTNDIKEWELFMFKERAELHLVNTIEQMANAIGSAKLFIGNQSAPLALASALDVPRICELDADPAPFYMGEEKYSKNIKWFLNNEINNL